MIRRILALMLSAFMIFTITACKKVDNKVEPEIGAQSEKEDEIKTISIITGEGYKREYDENTYNTVIEVSYPVVMPYYGDEYNFPKLAMGLEIGNTQIKEELVRFIEENTETAYEHYEASGEHYYPFESSVEAAVRRADAVVASILYTGFTYTGGVHGESYYYGENYDAESGKMLSVSDVVTDMGLLSSAMREQMELFHSDVIANGEMDLEGLINDENLYSWTLDYNGITFYFIPYSINLSSGDMVTITLANDEYPDVLKEEYKKTPAAYGIELTADVPFYYDVTGDGKTDEIRIGGYPVNEGNTGSISISVNDSVYNEENWFFEYDATLVHTADGRNYIYLEFLRENDYVETVCYDIKDGVKKVGSIDGGLRTIYHEGGEVLITQDALTNPESFYIQQSTQHLSTATGYRKYRIGDDGLFVSDEEYFMFDEERAHVLTALQDIEAEKYDAENGVTGEKCVIPNGSEVVYIGTDGERYALLNTIDGMFRIDTDGINIYEVFDGMSFAG